MLLPYYHNASVCTLYNEILSIIIYLCNKSVLFIPISISIVYVFAACAVNINADLGTPQPLYLYYHSPKLVQTSNRRSYFYLEADEKIDVFCSDGFQPPFSGGKTKTLTASCISGNRFDLNGRSESLRNVRCNRNAYSETKVTKRRCVAGNTVEIGFNVEGKSGLNYFISCEHISKSPVFNILFQRCMDSIDGNLS